MIDSFRESVIKELIRIFKNNEIDGNFNIEQEIVRLINNYPDALYSKIIYFLTKIRFDRKEGRFVFEELLDHWQNLNDKIGRDVGIKVASLDYFSNINKKLQNPQIVDKSVFHEIKENSDKDKLTNLYNYGYYTKRLKEEISIARRYKKVFSLVVIDIDDFKKYNDNYGHDEGNVVLEKLAGILLESVRDSDIVFRFGGEEFVLLLIETTKQGAFVVSERARKKISNVTSFKRKVTISSGISTFPIDAEKEEKLFELADKALYCAKKQGKDRVCLYHEDRRNSVRVYSQLKGKLCLFNKKEKCECELKDISNGGMSFYCEEKFNIGSKVKGIIDFPGEDNVKWEGKVLWSESFIPGKCISGVEFVNLTSDLEQSLGNYINLKVEQYNGDVICKG